MKLITSKHTEKPWEAEEYLSFAIIKGGGVNPYIANVIGLGISREEMMANAWVMAASPDLLEVAEDARRAIMSLERNALGNDEIDGYPYSLELLAKIDAALAKASGAGDGNE